MDQHPLTRLREALVGTLDHDQLIELCAGMGLQDEGLQHETCEGLASQLVGRATRQGRLSDLIQMAREAEPAPVWDEIEVPRGVRGAWTLRHQLPARVQGFVGRDDETRRVTELLKTKPAGTVIYGRGGVGKTSFAVHLAHHIADRYPDAQIVVQMGGSSGQPLGPLDAAERIIHAFEPTRRLPSHADELRSLYIHALTGQDAIVLLDDAASADQISFLTPPTGAVLLVTARRPLSSADLSLVHLGALTAGQAMDLLVGTIGAGAAANELDRITALCGRLPLALKIAGGLLALHPDWSTTYLSRELIEERRHLASLRFEDAEVEAALALAVGQMILRSPDLASRWQMLSLFPAPFDLIAAATVWDVTEPQALADLSDLVARGLILHDPQAGLYDLHELIRPAAEEAFSYEETDGAGDGEPLLRFVQRVRARFGWDPERRRMDRATTRHADHYLAIGAMASERYQEGGERTLEGLRVFDSAWPHLQEARTRMKTCGDRTAARWLSDLSRKMAPVLGQRLPPQQRIPVLEGAVTAATQIGDRRSQASHLGNLGLAYADMGEPQRAVAFHQQALIIAARLRDRRAEGTQLSYLGYAYLHLGEPEQAIDCYQKALEIHQTMGDKRAEAANLTGLAAAHRELGDTRQAIGEYERALTIARQIGDRRAEGAHLGNLGLGYRQLGDTERSIEYFEQALAIARRIDDRQRESAALGNLGLA